MPPNHTLLEEALSKLNQVIALIGEHNQLSEEQVRQIKETLLQLSSSFQGSELKVPLKCLEYGNDQSVNKFIREQMERVTTKYNKWEAHVRHTNSLHKILKDLIDNDSSFIDIEL